MESLENAPSFFFGGAGNGYGKGDGSPILLSGMWVLSCNEVKNMIKFLVNHFTEGANERCPDIPNGTTSNVKKKETTL
ncbi:MAG: hypothetical protein KBC20_02915 [Oscillospiraceae bacterium]|nr:hypothetical protein [Oscillospiraceae bacterium]